MSTVRLHGEASKLASKGHPWFYADDLQKTNDALHGRIVRVVSDRGDDLGLGFYSATSHIRLRRCGGFAGDGVPDPAEFFAARLAVAVANRAHLNEEPRGVRLVHGDSDGIPGLVVDQFDRCLVLQSTSAVVEENISHIVPWLRDRVGAISVVARNDLAVRRREGLPVEVRLLDGKRVEEVSIREHGVRHRVQVFTGQKTGFYLDQRPARRRVMELAAPSGLAPRRVLDLCSYQGGFALAALSGGAAEATAVDSSEDALARAEQAAQDNGVSSFTTVCADVFDWLRAARKAGPRFDLVVLDPPAFAKSRREIDGALRGYRDLNRLAIRVLAPGGYLLTCSCSHHVKPSMFEGVLRQSAAELPFRVWLRERISAGEDHPVWTSLPESEYRKVVLLQRGPDEVHT